MKSFTTLSFVLATLLGLLQFGGEAVAVASPIPPQDTSSGGYYVYVYAPSGKESTYDYSNMQYSYPQQDMSQYYMPQYPMPQYSMPQYSMPQYSTPQYAPQPQAPSYKPPQLPGEFEGLSDQDAIVGNDNIQFTGFDVLGNVNLPVNVLSITDILD